MKIKPETYFIIVSRKMPHTYQADFRVPKLIANDKNIYYRIGDITTKIEDAYKFELESDAISYLKKELLSNEDLEVRQLNVLYEVL